LSETPWLDRLRGGFRKTSDRLGDNLTGLFTKATLDPETLDDIEEALIASDLGPAAASRVRARWRANDSSPAVAH
jgi:fused signal recognition particle receptor